jgi:hypothetical protein
MSFSIFLPDRKIEAGSLRAVTRGIDERPDKCLVLHTWDGEHIHLDTTSYGSYDALHTIESLLRTYEPMLFEKPFIPA